MAHRTLINGTGYDISGGREMIGGTGYDCKAGKTLIGGTAFTIPFAKGIPIGTLPVGSVVKIGVNGKEYDFLVVNQGIPSNSSRYDSSCDGTWLLMKDIYEKRAWNSSNVNKYESSDIHAYLNSTFLNLFDSKIKNAIKQVKIPYRKNGGTGIDQSGANGLSVKIFLLSGFELGGSSTDNTYSPSDGAKLSYFEVGTGTSANNKRIAKLNGSAAHWRLRSQYIDNIRRVWLVQPNGDYGADDASFPYGIRPAFILSGTFPVIQNPDGTYSPAA